MKNKKIPTYPLQNVFSIDVYSEKHEKIFNNSITKTFGVISFEIKKQPTKKYKGHLIHALLLNLIDRTGRFDIPKEDFLEWLGNIYDARNKALLQYKEDSRMNKINKG